MSEAPAVLYDANNNPIPRSVYAPQGPLALSRSFDNGGPRARTRPGISGPVASGRGHRDHRSLETLIRDCQQLGRNDIVAKAINTSRVTYVIGPSPSLQAQSDNDSWNEETERKFRVWCEREADATGQTTLAGLARQVVENWGFEGDTLVRKIVTGSGVDMRVSLELIEALRLKNENGGQDDETHHGGVELENWKPKAYWVHDWNPTGTMLEIGSGRAVPASHAWMVANPREVRSGVYRTQPAFSASIDRLENVDKASEAQMKAFQLAAFLALVLMMDQASGTTIEDMQAQGMITANMARTAKEARDRGTWDLGTVLTLQPGEKVEQVDPKHPVTGFDTMLWTELQLVCSDLDTCLELVFAKLDKSWANSRAAISVVWEKVLENQDAAKTMFLNRAYRLWLQCEIHTGRTAKVPGWDRFEWILPAKPVLDQMSEFKGNQIGLSSSQTTLEKVLRQSGVADVRGHMKKLVEQAEFMRTHGLSFGHPVQTTRSELVQEEVDEDGNPISKDGDDG